MYRILIVEDDEIIARSLKKHLESWDYDVVCVEDFSDVMKEFAGAAPQLVLIGHQASLLQRVPLVQQDQGGVESSGNLRVVGVGQYEYRHGGQYGR